MREYYKILLNMAIAFVLIVDLAFISWLIEKNEIQYALLLIGCTILLVQIYMVVIVVKTIYMRKKENQKIEELRNAITTLENKVAAREGAESD